MTETRHFGNIVLVDDQEGFAYLTQLILQELSTQMGRIQYTRVNDPTRINEFLKKEGECDEAPTPQLIILDVHMPQRNGVNVLRDLRANPSSETIPIVVMSDRFTPELLAEAYKSGANACIAKPATLDEFELVFRSLVTFFFKIARLP